MTIDLYYLNGSAPATSVRLLANAIGVELNLKELNLFAGEHLKPEFVKINPQHTIPTLVDDGFSLWESRAILVYLLEKYAPDSPLYPKDVESRALVNQRLYFDLGTLYQRFGDYFYPQAFGNAPADPEKLKKAEEALEFLNTFLEGHTFAAGNELTVADFALVVSVATIECAGLDVNKHKNVAKWFAKCKEVIPGYHLVQESVDAFTKFAVDKVKKQ